MLCNCSGKAVTKCGKSLASNFDCYVYKEKSMRGNIISYMEMCQKEDASLQKGMNFRLKGRHSVVLMSVRVNSPYQDEITEDGTVLIYEGHDVPNTKDIVSPKLLDQPE